MKTVAIIGAGISGLTSARILQDNFRVTVFEQHNRPGGLIRCIQDSNGLFHLCGGHVFNTKNEEVSQWFWSHFDRDREFSLTKRNATIILPSGERIGYPIEYHLYQLPTSLQTTILRELSALAPRSRSCTNLKDFFISNFGQSLSSLYFEPYNTKIWRKDLSSIPMSWLDGKLPMPSREDIFAANTHKSEEGQMPHASFWYAHKNGSQFIADRLSEGLDIVYNTSIKCIRKTDSGKYDVGGSLFDLVVFCGNIKALPKMASLHIPDDLIAGIAKLSAHGTTSVFSLIDKNPFSWIYLPSKSYSAHRIICTGNFSHTNNADGNCLSATVEFTGAISQEEILHQFKNIPFHPHYVTSNYEAFTYPIQDSDSRNTIAAAKNILARERIFLVGRFAEWEYYNMDAAIASAMRTAEQIKNIYS